MPTEGRAASRWSEPRLIAALMRAMLLAAALAALVLAWRYASGPARPVDTPSVRVAMLPPGGFVWASAPGDTRYLPPGVPADQAAHIKLLVLRTLEGQIHAFFMPWHAGRASLPVGGTLTTPGLPCLDLAPQFDTLDIACRQPAPGFEFAQRHRWSLTGQALSAGTPHLTPAPGHEADGEWLLEPSVPLAPSGVQ
ncbi:MAG: hypothetical protein Q4F13_12160 [Pseudomonadota bacterium]|nr:hypothetical protein [Pseudomonadota bacterium]